MQAYYATNRYSIDDFIQEQEDLPETGKTEEQASEEEIKAAKNTLEWILKNMVKDPSAAIFHGWESEIMREDLAEDIIDGIALLDPEKKPIARFCLYSDKIDPTAILSYAANNGEMTLAIYDISNLDQAKEEFRKIRELAVPEVNSLMEKNHCSMYPVIWVDGREIIDMEHKIH